MSIVLFDMLDGNLVDEYDTREAALAFVREVIAERGREAVAGWSLGSSDRSEPAICGDDLITLALPVSA